MKGINRENIEAYMLDLYEGRLSMEEEMAFRDYLRQHPEFEALLLEDSIPVLGTSKLSYGGKEALKKEFPHAGTTISRENFDMACIGSLEGDLSPEQFSILESLRAEDSGLEKQWLEWQQSRLQAPAIFYPGKQQLKKRGPVLRPLLWTAVLVAATLALFIIVGRGFISPEDLVVPQLSVEEAPVLSLPSSGEEFVLVAEEPVPAEIENNLPRIPVLLLKKARAEAISAPEIRRSQLAFLQSVHPLRGERDRIDPMQLAVLGVGENSMTEPWADRALKQSYRRFIQENDLSLTRVASAGVEGINALTGSDMELNVSRDAKGEVKGYRFRSFFLSVDAPLKRVQ